MPPKQKFERKEIAAAALAVIRHKGIEALTARGLGEELESSPRPIFTVFKSMDEVREEALTQAKALYNEYIQKGLYETPAFKGVGTQHIQFAKKEPKLFHLLFMTEQESSPALSNVLPVIDENHEKILESVQSYGLSKSKSQKLYQYLWLFSHGTATLYATNICRLTDEQVSEMLTDVFIGALKKIKEEPEESDDD